MAVPKKKRTRSRSRHKKAAWKVTAAHTLACPRCGSPRLSHRACSNCGTYRGREVLSVKD